MTVAVSTLLHRVADILGVYPEWFDAVAAWYDNARWTKRIFRDYLAARTKPACRAFLAINDVSELDHHRDPSSNEASPTWWIPASAFQPGENLLFLRIDPGDAGFAFDGVSVEQAARLVPENRREHRPRPRATAQVAAAICLGAGFRPNVDRWDIQASHQSMRFALRFEGRPPAQFLLGLTVKLPTVGYSLLLEDLWDFVCDKIRDKIRDLIKEYFRRLEARDPRAQSLEQQIQDLQNYLEIHETNLAHALAAEDNTTLEEIIQKSKKPVRVKQAEPPTVEPVKDAPRTVKPIKDSPRSTPAPPSTPAAGLHWFVKLLLVGFFLGLTVVVFGISAWLLGLVNVNRFAWFNEVLVQGGGPVPNDARERELINQLQARGAQTGEVQVSLFWTTKNDLDLEVVEPGNEKVFWGHRRSKTGGRLDIDMNVVYNDASRNAVENVFWPKGKAPSGRYKVYVNHFHNHGKADCEDPARFTVRVLIRGTPQWFHGEVPFKDAKRRRVLVHEFDVR